MEFAGLAELQRICNWTPTFCAASRKTLPGDKMFQATEPRDGYARPIILHRYGGAKKSIPAKLPALAKQGWTTANAALLELEDHEPCWCGGAFTPVMGTTIYLRPNH